MLSCFPIQHMLQVISMIYPWFTWYLHDHFYVLFFTCRVHNLAENKTNLAKNQFFFGSAEPVEPAFCKSMCFRNLTDGWWLKCEFNVFTSANLPQFEVYLPLFGLNPGHVNCFSYTSVPVAWYVTCSMVPIEECLVHTIFSWNLI